MSDWRKVPEPIKFVNDLGQVWWQAQINTGAVATEGGIFGTLIWRFDSGNRPWLCLTKWGARRLARKQQKKMAKIFWEDSE